MYNIGIQISKQVKLAYVMKVMSTENWNTRGRSPLLATFSMMKVCMYYYNIIIADKTTALA